MEWFWQGLTSYVFMVAEQKIKCYANSRDPDEVAHYEPPHLALYFLQV